MRWHPYSRKKKQTKNQRCSSNTTLHLKLFFSDPRRPPPAPKALPCSPPPPEAPTILISEPAWPSNDGRGSRAGAGVSNPRPRRGARAGVTASGTPRPLYARRAPAALPAACARAPVRVPTPDIFSLRRPGAEWPIGGLLPRAGRGARWTAGGGGWRGSRCPGPGRGRRPRPGGGGADRRAGRARGTLKSRIGRLEKEEAAGPSSTGGLHNLQSECVPIIRQCGVPRGGWAS